MGRDEVRLREAIGGPGCSAWPVRPRRRSCCWLLQGCVVSHKGASPTPRTDPRRTQKPSAPRQAAIFFLPSSSTTSQYNTLQATTTMAAF